MVNKYTVRRYDENSNSTDITDLVSDMTIEEHTSTYGRTLNISVLKNINDKTSEGVEAYQRASSIINGSKLLLFWDDDLVGIYVVQTISHANNIATIMAQDFFYLLNNSMLGVLQVQKNAISNAISALLDKIYFQYEFRGCPELSSTNFTNAPNEIYKGETPSTILRDMLDRAYRLTGKKYTAYIGYDTASTTEYLETFKVIISPVTNKSVQDKVEDEQGNEIPLYSTIRFESISQSKSIVELRNFIEVWTDNGTDTVVSAKREDPSSINVDRYGRLYHYVSYSQDKGQTAQSLADELFADMNREHDSLTFKCAGSPDIWSGMTMDLEIPQLGIKKGDDDDTNYHEVLGVTHEISGNKYTVTLELRKKVEPPKPVAQAVPDKKKAITTKNTKTKKASKAKKGDSKAKKGSKMPSHAELDALFKKEMGGK